VKPISIDFRAFGSYPGEVTVDFTALAARGIFVVSGDTGTGKTTIFDAMTYALYGSTPLKEATDVRSHHADPDVESYVRFTFEIGSDRYVAERKPEWIRPAMRGGGRATQRATALLSRITADGTEPIASGIRDVAPACTELLGLTGEQFQRVILLPQGEITKFLLAGSGEREELLGRLFGGEVFDRVVNELKDRLRDSSAEVASVDHDIDVQLRTARQQTSNVMVALELPAAEGLDELDRIAIEEVIDGCAEPLEQRAAAHAQAAQRAQRAAEAHTQATEAAGRFTRAAELRDGLVALEARSESVSAGRTAALASAAARPVTDAADVAAQANAELESARAALEACLKPVRAALGDLGVVDCDLRAAVDVTAAVAERRAHVLALATKLDAEREASSAVSDAATAGDRCRADRDGTAGQLQTVTDRLTAIDDELPGVIERAIDVDELDRTIERAESAVRRRGELDRCRERAQRAMAGATAAVDDYDAVFRRFVATQAPRLAAELVGGDPCPVCGSSEHPSPAVADSGDQADDAALERATTRRDAAEGERNELVREVAQLEAELGDDASAPVDALNRRVQDLTDRRAAAIEARDRRVVLERDRTELATRRESLVTTLAGLNERLTTLGSDLDERREAHERAATLTAGIDAESVAADTRSLADLDELTEGLDARFAAVTNNTGAAANADAAVRRAIESSEFGTVEAAAAVLLSVEDESQRLRAADAHQQELTQHTAALETLTSLGVPETAPDVQASESEQAATAAERDALHEQVTSASGAAEQARQALAEHDRVGESSRDLRERHERIQLATSTCSKGGALHIPLRRWVLANELDRVTAAANVHLDRMTAGRYSLRRCDQVANKARASGLDLEVLDATTGRARATSSLSGGEQFQASLSLALGLADVVSQGGASSGKRFEALFVDEGFGTLDPNALDDAIEALRQLHESGRMVGAITHVEEMKQQLHVGIEVRRLPDGAGSELIVHP
jgi:exonuclease SbcC